MYAIRSYYGGELCVFLGPSGCGKSTTLRLLNRLLDLDSGNITIDDVNIGVITSYSIHYTKLYDL